MSLVERVYALDTNLNVAEGGATGVNDLVDKIAAIIGIIAGALAFIYLLYSGILYVTANGNPDQAKKAQTGIINAIIGIVIIVAAYFIFTAIRGTAQSQIL